MINKALFFIYITIIILSLPIAAGKVLAIVQALIH